MADPIYVAIKSCTVEHEGQAWVLRDGETRLTSGHPCVKARPELFKRVAQQRPDAKHRADAKSGTVKTAKPTVAKARKAGK